MKSMLITLSAIAFLGWCISPVQADISVTYTIDTQQDVSPISPYIYGYNFEQVSAQNLTVRRMGGNRLTGYNWETNFSNAGSDWQHSSDEYMSSYIPSAQRQTPGKVITDFVDANLAAGRASLITLQMAGYVAADKNGTVTESQAAPSTRWKEVVYQKTTPFCSPAKPRQNRQCRLYG